MIDLLYLGHNFIISKFDLEHDTKNGINYICKVCRSSIVYWESSMHDSHNGKYWIASSMPAKELKLTCKEVIIKNIIE